jgi:hypothetical protein
MTGKGAIDFDQPARQKLDCYLEDVRKELDGIDPKERKAILEEIDSALEEKLEITAGEKGVEKISLEMAGEVLEGFGSPSELAKGYAKVARAGTGRMMKLLSLFEAFWAVFIFIPGAYLLVDAIIFWWPDLVSYGQVLLGVFFLVGGASIFVLIWLQLRDTTVRQQIGPFAMITTMTLGFAGLSTVGIDRDFLLPGMPQSLTNLFLTILTGFLLVGGVWGLGNIIANLKKDSTASPEEQPQVRSRRFPSKSRNIIALTTTVLVSLFIIANGLLMTGGGLGNGRPNEGDKVYVNSEYIGGPYNASIEHWQGFTGEYWSDFYKIVYTFNGTRINGSMQLEMRPALDWIKGNTSSNDTVVSWWDYGHEIRGYTGRDSAIYMASKNLVNTMADRNKEGRPWESEEKVRAVSNILLAQNETQLRQGMAGFGAKYILTTQRDSSGIAYAVFEGAGKNPDDYLRVSEGIYYPRSTAQDMLLFRIWAGGNFNGTKLVYKDINTMILELI